MASSSSTSRSSLTKADSRRHSLWTYDVFLSFRGEDTRKTFIGHLYEALDRKGINVFKDDIKLPRGESIAPELLKAIEESEIAIIVFSKRYGSSSWCLDELVKIMECRKELGQVVLPVFYDIEPTDVRKQTGDFGEAFSKHSIDSRVKIWKEALEEAAGIAGINNTAYGCEAQCINEIVETISPKFMQTNSTIEDKLVGLDSRIEKVVSSLKLDSGGVRMMGIWGMGGAGKTTLARAVFNKISSYFDGGICFLENVREVCQNNKGNLGIVKEQEKILCSILKGKYELDDVYHGKSMICRWLCRKKVLIVLDDVADLSQLEELAGSHGWFGEGSRILITTRDQHLLLAHEVNEILHVTLLNDKEAIELFRRYAFGMRDPTLKFEELSHRVVCYAKGLPLALKTLGSYLRNKDVAEWKSVFARLPDDPETKILDVLKISYDELKPTEKEIFLDVACFFKGWEIHRAMRILDCCGFYPDIGVKVLIQKSLLTITTNNRFEMHDLVQEMGRHIVRGPDPKNPLKHSRVWQIDDLIKIDGVANETIEALVEDIQYVADKYRARDKFWETEFGESLDYMKRLRLLCVIFDHQEPGYLSNELRWLSWNHYPSRCLPSSFQAQKLVGLQIQRGELVELWEEEKHLPELKFLDLRYCRKLFRTPNFKGTPKLEMLDLQYCSELAEIHSSIGSLEKLVHVYLSHCYKLKTFPTIVSMKSLETLVFSCCYSLSKFPSSLSQLSRLKVFVLDNCSNLEALPMLPSSIGILHANKCSSLRSLEGAPKECEWLWKASFRRCPELERNEQTSVVANRLIQAMLKGNAAANHHFSILLPGGDIAVRLFRPVMGPEFVLKLPPNEYGEISGIKMCAVFRSIHSYDNIEVEVEPATEENGGLSDPMPLPDQSLPYSHFWFGYMSSSFFGYTDLFQSSSSLLFSFGHHKMVAEMCWVSPVYEKNKKPSEILECSHFGEYFVRRIFYRPASPSDENVKCMNILTSAHNDGMNKNSVKFRFGINECPGW